MAATELKTREALSQLLDTPISPELRSAVLKNEISHYAETVSIRECLCTLADAASELFSPRAESAAAMMHRYDADSKSFVDGLLKSTIEGSPLDSTAGMARLLHHADMEKLAAIASALKSTSPEEEREVREILELLKTAHKADAVALLAPRALKELAGNRELAVMIAMLSQTERSTGLLERVKHLGRALCDTVRTVRSAFASMLEHSVRDLLGEEGTSEAGEYLTRFIRSSSARSSEAALLSRHDSRAEDVVRSEQMLELWEKKKDEAYEAAAVVLAAQLLAALEAAGKARQHEEQKQHSEMAEQERHREEQVRRLAESVLARHSVLLNSSLAEHLKQTRYLALPKSDAEIRSVEVEAIHREEDRWALQLLEMEERRERVAVVAAEIMRKGTAA